LPLLTGARIERGKPRLLDRALLVTGAAVIGWIVIEILSLAYGVEASGSIVEPLLALLN
jgi:hypothetical protein